MSRKTLTAAEILDNAVTEKTFRQQVIGFAKLYGWKCYFSWTSIHSPRGYPDLCLCKPPRLVFAELKTMKKTSRPSPEQIEWLDLLSATPHCEVFLWRPDCWEVIQTVLASPEPYQGPERWTRGKLNATNL